MQYCSTCLSSDRNCVKLSDRPEFWETLNLLDVDLSVATDYICWECASIFKRIARFRTQILQAQGFLRNCSKLLHISPGGKCTKKIQLETLSQLSSVTKNAFDNIYVEEENKTEFKFVTPDDQSVINDSENFEVVFIDDWDKDLNVQNSDVKNNETAIDISNETDTEKSEIEDNIYVEEENKTEFKFVTPDDESVINDSEYFEVESIDDWDTVESDAQNFNVKKNETAIDIRNETVEKCETEEIKIAQKPPYDYKVVKDLRVFKQEEMYTITNMSMQEMFKARDVDRDNPRYKNCPYKCIKCITGFFEEDKYKKHLELHDPSLDANKKLRKCPICELRCRRGRTYDSHYDRHFRLYTCTSCDYSDHRLAKMTQHHERNHNKVYECKICHEKFKLPRSLKYHYETSHREKPKCEVCGKVVSTKSNLKIHMLVHTGAPRAACTVCGRVVRASRLLCHARTHAPRAPDAYCAECDVSFATDAFYRQHLRLSKRHRHEDQLKHACAQCPARFVGRHALTLHVTALHLKAHPFKCDICGKAFMRKCRIKAHIMEKHEGKTKPKDKMCSFCGKAFHSNALLKKHVRIHTGERPFACEHCPAAFAQKSTLSTHVKALHKHANT